jgi:hypothetical protein
MRGGLLFITALAVLVPAGSAQGATFDVTHFSWSARLTFEEVNSAGEPESIRDEQGETVSSFRYRVPRSGGASFVLDRRASVETGQRYTVSRNATWRENWGAGFEPRDCIDIDRRRGGGGATFSARGDTVRVNWDLPVALDTCGPSLYDDLELANKLEQGSRQVIPRNRFAGRLRLGIRGRQVLRPDESGVRAVLTWRAQMKIARR